MRTKFMFMYPLFDCILENEEELSVDNQDETIVSIYKQMKNLHPMSYQ